MSKTEYIEDSESEEKIAKGPEEKKKKANEVRGNRRCDRLETKWPQAFPGGENV